MAELIKNAGAKPPLEIVHSAHPIVSRSHSMPFGAQFIDAETGTRFRLWAPSAPNITLQLNDVSYRMNPLEGGWYELTVKDALPGTLYQYRVELPSGQSLLVPDPASRYQPKDVHGPSQVIDPRHFQWQDTDWMGRPWEEAMIYELHVGTFSPEHSFQGVENKLDYLADLGITAIELMPVADFPGLRNWGYDGVLPFAPDSRYGTPDDLKSLIQAAHQRGIMVFLDVVYNHFGPDGNYLSTYAQPFFAESEQTPWGSNTINFSGQGLDIQHGQPIREFFIHNALYWLEEYHFDGLRLDAVHSIFDASQTHFLEELAETIRNIFPQERQLHLVLENAENQAHLLQSKLYTAQWNDDFHHAAHVLLSGEKTGYYADYSKENSTYSPIEHFARCLTEGFTYQGQASQYHGAGRGEVSTHLPPVAFVNFLQNHDQVGNRALAERLSKLASPAAIKAAVSILLLAPSIPLIFMGEEWQSEKPFWFFSDLEPELGEKVRQGRLEEFTRFEEFNNPDIQKKIADPTAWRTFEASSLDWNEPHQPPYLAWHAFYKHLLEIRQAEIWPRIRHWDAVLQPQKRYQILEETAFSALWTLPDYTQLILIANLGDEAIPFQPDDHIAALSLIWQSNHQTWISCRSGKIPAWSVVWGITPGEPI